MRSLRDLIEEEENVVVEEVKPLDDEEAKLSSLKNNQEKLKKPGSKVTVVI